MRNRSERGQPPTAQERDYIERELAVQTDALANDLSLALDVPFDHVRDVLRADLEAHVAMSAQDEAPYTRRFFPDGSLPPMPDASDVELARAAADAVRRHLSGRIPPDTIERVLELLEANARAQRRSRRRTRIWSRTMIVLMVVAGILFLIGTFAGPADPDPDGVWSGPVIDAISPLADTIDGPYIIECIGGSRDGEQRAGVTFWVPQEVADGDELRAALEAAGLPAGDTSEYTHFADDDDFDIGQFVVVLPIDGEEFTSVTAHSPCGRP